MGGGQEQQQPADDVAQPPYPHRRGPAGSEEFEAHGKQLLHLLHGIGGRIQDDAVMGLELGRGSRQQHLTAVMLDFTKRCNYCVDLHNARTMLRSCIITEESAQLPG